MKIRVRPSTLHGHLHLQGSKHAAMVCIPAAVICGTHLANVPNCGDVQSLNHLLKDNGIRIDRGRGMYRYYNAERIDRLIALASDTRHAALLLGLGCALNLPVSIQLKSLRGCKIGHRPLDIHINALRKLGTEIEEADGLIRLLPSKLTGAVIRLRYPSFSATANIILAALRADGTTYIINAATNPEIVDMVRLLIRARVSIRYANTHTLVIKGSATPLKSICYALTYDRIVCATYITAAALAGARVEIYNADATHIMAEIVKWRECGVPIQVGRKRIVVSTPRRLISGDIWTKAYPAFHTDNQPLHGLLMTQAYGYSVIRDGIFDDRFQYLQELAKMGARVDIKDDGYLCPNGKYGKIAVITKSELGGGKVIAPDIRGGAALVLAGLIAKGETVVENAEVIGRGYENIVRDLKKLGGDIEWQK